MLRKRILLIVTGVTLLVVGLTALYTRPPAPTVPPAAPAAPVALTPLVKAATDRVGQAAELLRHHAAWLPATSLDPAQLPVDAMALPLVLHTMASQAVAEASQGHVAGWLREGLARHVTETALEAEPWAALDLLAPTGPVALTRLAALPPGTLAVTEYERAVATARLLAAFLEERQRLDKLVEALAAQAAPDLNEASLAALGAAAGLSQAELEAEFTSWLEQRQAAHARAAIDRSRPVIPSDPMPWMRSYSHSAPPVRAKYTLDVAIDPEVHRLSGRQTVRIPNNEAVPLDSLYFHLFPNALAFTQLRGETQDRRGSLTVQAVRVGGQSVPFTGGSDEILGLLLPSPLAPGEAVTVELEWQETVPSKRDRFGSEGATLYLGNFYPILAVHDAGGWHLDRYVGGGDPFYSEVADYDVTLTMPPAYAAAATGRLTSPEPGRYHFEAQQVRDFAAAVSPDWTVHTETVDGIRLHLYAPKPGTSKGSNIGTPETAMALIRDTVRFFSEQFGPYPYEDLTVVGQLGMEYPQVAMAANPNVIVHEIAHQWWYGVAGNDELRQIWDEGLTVFSERYYHARGASKNGSSGGPLPMDRSLYQMEPGETPDDYRKTIYSRGWMLWEALRTAMGDEAFLEMIRQFYARHQYGIATWADWRTAVTEAGGTEAVAVFDSYVYGAELPAGAPTTVAPRKE